MFLSVACALSLVSANPAATVDTSEVTRAAREYRIKIYQDYRHHRAAYNELRRRGDSLLAHWHRSGRPEGYQQQVIQWFRSSTDNPAAARDLALHQRLYSLHRPGTSLPQITTPKQLDQEPVSGPSREKLLEAQAYAGDPSSVISDSDDDLTLEQIADTEIQADNDLESLTEIPANLSAEEEQPRETKDTETIAQTKVAQPQVTQPQVTQPEIAKPAAKTARAKPKSTGIMNTLFGSWFSP